MNEEAPKHAPQSVHEEEAKLYRVYSTVDGWKHRHWFFDGVTITWLARRVAKDRYRPPWVEEPVVDVRTGEKNFYLASAVDELFTREEAEAFVAYLKERYGDDTARMWEYPTPVPACNMGLGDIPVGGGVSTCLVQWKEGYPFDFEVEGYYDLRDLEPTHREPYRECATPGCLEDGVRIWKGPNDEPYEKDEEGWVHQCEQHCFEDVCQRERGTPAASVGREPELEDVLESFEQALEDW